MTNDYMTLAEIDVENSVAMDFRTKMRTTAFHAKCLHLAMGVRQNSRMSWSTSHSGMPAAEGV